MLDGTDAPPARGRPSRRLSLMSNQQPISTFLGIAAAVVLVSSSYAAIINVGPGDFAGARCDPTC